MGRGTIWPFVNVDKESRGPCGVAWCIHFLDSPLIIWRVTLT